MVDLSGRTGIVTGAGNGIGQACALAMARAGANVVVVDLDAAAAEKTVAQIAEEGGVGHAITADVTRSDDVSAMTAQAIETFGRVDFAHNNAGIFGGTAILTDLDEADWRRVIDVNLTSVYLCMKNEIAAMLESGRGGSIVNTASFSGLVGVPFAAAYVASKHGVVGLTKAAAIEYGRKGIRVNAVCPGTVRTAMMEERIAENPKLEKALFDVSPMRRLTEASEVADAVVWLCSDESSFVNGHALPVDGGATIQ